LRLSNVARVCSAFVVVVALELRDEPDVADELDRCPVESLDGA
jgi:hypothetical protein